MTNAFSLPPSIPPFHSNMSKLSHALPTIRGDQNFFAAFSSSSSSDSLDAKAAIMCSSNLQSSICSCMALNRGPLPLVMGCVEAPQVQRVKQLFFITLPRHFRHATKRVLIKPLLFYSACRRWIGYLRNPIMRRRRPLLTPPLTPPPSLIIDAAIAELVHTHTPPTLSAQ